MRSVFVFVFVACFLGVLFADELNVSLHPQGKNVVPVVREGVAYFSTEYQFGMPGQPLLPSYTVSVIIPDNSILDSINVTLTNVTEALPMTNMDVPPIPLDPLSGTYSPGTTIVDGRDASIYGHSDDYPSDYVGSFYLSERNGVPLLNVRVYPYKYNPGTMTLKHFNSATLHITFDGDSMYQATINSVSEYDFRMVAQLQNSVSYAINPYLSPIIINNPQIGTSKNQLHIITTNDIFQNSKQIGRYILSKNDRGYDVTTVTETKTYVNNNKILDEGWGGGTGEAAADTIRQWIRDNKNNPAHPINYILLIGDPDPIDGDVPMKITHLLKEECDRDPTCPKPRRRLLPTDYYYAEINKDYNGSRNQDILFLTDSV